MSSWHSYPKIYNIGHPQLDGLFDGPVLVEEKVDGSQFSFGLFNGEIKVRSKGQEMQVSEPEKLFTEGVTQVMSRRVHLHEGWTYRGEYLKKPKHNALAYDRIPNSHVILFDINTDEERYLPYEEKKAEAERIGFECIPLVHNGVVSNAGEVLALLDRVSVLGGQKVEGLVVKNYARFGKDGKALMGKYVSEAFKEVHKAEWKKDNPTAKDIVGLLGEQYRTPARWNKAIQHMAERGELTNSPKDIGPLIRETQQDITAECAEEIKSALYSWAKPHIMRAAIRGLPEFYKKKLLGDAFEEGQEAGLE